MASQENLPRALDVQRFAETRKSEVSVFTCSYRSIWVAVGFYTLFCPTQQEHDV